MKIYVYEQYTAEELKEQIKLKDVLKTTHYKPLFGNKRAKTHWLVFMKGC